MAVAIALLRGVNIGGHHMIRMAALNQLCESLALRDPVTYLQSGNVVFETRARDLVRLAGRMEDSLERSFGFRPAVMLRTVSELRDVIARNPFATRSGIDPSRLAVTFLARDPGPQARARFLGIRGTDGEELRIDGRELYLHFPNGFGRSQVTPAVMEKALGTSGTSRNWNTVTKLLAIAEAREVRAG